MVQLNKKSGLYIVLPLALASASFGVTVVNANEDHHKSWSEELREHHPEIYNTMDGSPEWQPINPNLAMVGNGRRLRATPPNSPHNKVDTNSENGRLANFGRWLTGETSSPTKKKNVRGDTDRRNLYEDYVPEGGYKGQQAVDGEIPNLRNSANLQDAVRNGQAQVPVERYQETHAHVGGGNIVRQASAQFVNNNGNDRRKLRASGNGLNLRSDAGQLMSAEEEYKEYVIADKPQQQAVQGSIPNLRSSDVREEAKVNYQNIKNNNGNVIEEMNIPVERLPKNMRGSDSSNNFQNVKANLMAAGNNNDYKNINIANQLGDSISTGNLGNGQNLQNLKNNNQNIGINDVVERVENFASNGKIGGGGLRRRN